MSLLKAPTHITPPMAARIDHTSSHHGYTVIDAYAWLRDPSYPDVKDAKVLDYLSKENEYFKAVMQPQAKLTQTIFQEIKGRIKEDDASVPWTEGGFEYCWAFTQGAQYRIWYRRIIGTEVWTIIFDENAEAGTRDFFKLGAITISPDGQYMAYSVDDNGSERFTIRVKDLTNDTLLSTLVEETSGEVVWTTDSHSFFYTIVSKEWRPYLVKLHELLSGDDSDIYEELETSYFTHISASSSKKYLIIRTADHVTAEVRILPTSNPKAALVVLAPRRAGHDYYVDHGQGEFFIRSNRDHKNFGICLATEASPEEKYWQNYITGSNAQYIRDMAVFEKFIAVQERIDGLDMVRICTHAGGQHHIEFPEAAYEAELGNNPNYEAGFVRLTYTSMVTPNTVFDYDGEDKRLDLRKEQEIPSGYDKQDYTTERLMVPVRDGVVVPVSVVYKNTWKKDSAAPLHLYGYGAYGLGMSPSFSAARLSLLDRGFAYAIAHIRGGDEMGYSWYEDGKLTKRTNTFNDFVDVAKYLESAGYAVKGGISISGGSAGGELMGAAVNQAPDLFSAAVMHVPFVDVLNTMLDATLPLTPIEWPEWGNPLTDKHMYELIHSYCPYTQIAAKDYPPMMVTGGLNDPRVTYWEPAKWTAKIRHMKTDDNLLVMKINMGAGHGGKSGRFERLHEVAEEYTFLMMAHEGAGD